MRHYITLLKSHPVHLAVFFFFVGILAGTAGANGMGAELREQLGAAGLIKLSESFARPGAGYFFSVFAGRGMTAAVFWLLGLSLLAVPGVCLAAAFLGFSMAFLLSCMTIQTGVWGLFLFLASIFPQCLFYLPAGAVLVFWALSGNGEGRQKIHLAGFCVVLFTTAAGTAAELWINPRILHLVSSWMIS